MYIKKIIFWSYKKKNFNFSKLLKEIIVILKADLYIRVIIIKVSEE